MQKLIETALSASVPALLQASFQLLVPSAFQPIQFDRAGRTSRYGEVVLQYRPALPGKTIHDVKLIVPYNIGQLNGDDALVQILRCSFSRSVLFLFSR
ncbi:MAG: hypothetical protein Q7T57_09305 [Dehalococcoidales bacterium]|nr:hypothetical protein [Dehalococcoidales bacterium]